MAEYYKGTVRQATRAAETLSWEPSHRQAGDELKMSFLSEADATLDNSKSAYTSFAGGKGEGVIGS